VKESLSKHKQYLLTGVSYVIPFIACGGILIALSVTYAFEFHLLNEHGGPDFTNAPWFVKSMSEIGAKAFELFPVVLAGFIAYGMAGRPGLVPGFVGGAIAALPLRATQAAHIGTAAAGTDTDPALLYRVPLAPALDGNTVDPQLEQASFAENAVRYQATLTLLNARLRGLMTAITGQ